MMGKELVFRVGGPEQLEGVGEKLLSGFPAHRVFAFYGELGVGKTTFIKAICRNLGVEDVVSSPTYSLINEYRLVDGGRVYHFDFYRVKKLEEVFDLGYEDYFYSGDFCFIEWPEKLETLIPESCCRVFMKEEKGKRVIHAESTDKGPALG
jgi:tRNA threonylcarbamoyladenosine biosynthesis protein TsaE